VHIVLTAAAKGRSKGSRQRKQHAASSAARSAAAWPAVSTALAAAKRLLPGMPVRLQDVKVELKVRMRQRCSWHKHMTVTYAGLGRLRSSCRAVEVVLQRCCDVVLHHSSVAAVGKCSCKQLKRNNILTLSAAVLPWHVSDMQGQGLVLKLRKAALQWAVPEEQGKLNGTLLLQDFTLSAGAHVAATSAAYTTAVRATFGVMRAAVPYL
jgi:hypothetical protein